MPPPLYLSLFFSLDLNLKNMYINTKHEYSSGFCLLVSHWCGIVSSHLQVFITVTLQGTGLFQVTSDLSQVLYLCLQRLNLRQREKVQSQVKQRELAS